MNVHEYQAKEILARFGITIPEGYTADSVEEAEKIAHKLIPNKLAVKAQIHAGGRGKAGGVKLVTTPEEVRAATQGMLGKVLVTHQTGPEGRKVNKVLVAVAEPIQRELYVSMVIDRTMSRPAVLASSEGGVDIETVAAATPEKIVTEIIDPGIGMMPYQARKIAYALDLGGELLQPAVLLLLNLYRAFSETDATMVEINPLIVTVDGRIMALDAKMSFDDNSLFRHKDIVALRDLEEEDPREVAASEHNLNYIGLDGNIGCMVNGAGLAMATMDIIKYYGGSPANFLDVGGGASSDQVTEAFKILCGDKNVHGILVNIFGGIMKCDIIANGILTAVRQIQVTVPLVVRLEGTNVEAGKKLLSESGLPIIAADSMADAARKIVEAVEIVGN